MSGSSVKPRAAADPVELRPVVQTAILEQVLVWIEQNAHRGLALADIAEAAGMSVRTLARRFTAEVGQSPIQWLAGVRIRQA